MKAKKKKRKVAETEGTTSNGAQVVDPTSVPAYQGYSYEPTPPNLLEQFESKKQRVTSLRQHKREHQLSYQHLLDELAREESELAALADDLAVLIRQETRP